jgi:hypothetical protein
VNVDDVLDRIDTARGHVLTGTGQEVLEDLEALRDDLMRDDGLVPQRLEPDRHDGRTAQEWEAVALELEADVHRLEARLGEGADVLAKAHRATALQAAARAWPNAPEPQLIEGAARLAHWIATGEHDGADAMVARVAGLEPLPDEPDEEQLERIRSDAESRRRTRVEEKVAQARALTDDEDDRDRAELVEDGTPTQHVEVLT